MSEPPDPGTPSHPGSIEDPSSNDGLPNINADEINTAMNPPSPPPTLNLTTPFAINLSRQNPCPWFHDLRAPGMDLIADGDLTTANIFTNQDTGRDPTSSSALADEIENVLSHWNALREDAITVTGFRITNGTLQRHSFTLDPNSVAFWVLSDTLGFGLVIGGHVIDDRGSQEMNDALDAAELFDDSDSAS
jgi:hypothetical protein